MNQTIIVQGSPRIEIVFYHNEFEIKGEQNSIIGKTKYELIQEVEFQKGKIPWLTGIITTVIDLVTGHGVGSWKRGKGKIELKLNSKKHIIELINYDREQTLFAINLLNEKNK